MIQTVRTLTDRQGYVLGGFFVALGHLAAARVWRELPVEVVEMIAESFARLECDLVAFERSCERAEGGQP